MTRSSPPGMPQEDYEAIEAAVMETARGRWFLSEFARRNRTADTQVLLEAIARLEDQIATGKDTPPTPHEPVSSTALVSSAKAELFAVEPPPMPQVQFPALPEPPDLAWVEEPESAHGDIAIDIFELDDDLIIPTEKVPAVMTPAPAPRAEPETPVPAQGRMLAGALAQAEEEMARAAEPAPPPPPTAFSPPLADPADLDALSFEEKSVYFA